MTQLYPLTSTPVLQDYIWGGRNLERLFGRKLPPDTDIAESWEIAAHPDGASIIANGPFAGISLIDLQQQLGIDLIGTRNQWAYERDKFPLLIKLLDANRALSVQVHPDDVYALAHEGNELGKTEMWVILHADPEAAIILGFKKGVTEAAFRQAVAAGKLEPLLHRMPVKTGDFVCVPAGTVHAILAGCVIAEIQQNSNATYRVYDWNRLGSDGRLRELHVDKALDVIDFTVSEPTVGTAQLIESADGVCRYQLCRNRYFTVERVAVAPGARFHGNCDGRTFEIWGAVHGAATVQSAGDPVTLHRVAFALLPAAMGKFTVEAHGETTLLRAFVA